MDHPATGSALRAADFGRKSLSRTSLLVANHYRAAVALLISTVILWHVLLVATPSMLVVTSLIYAAYVFLRFVVLAQREQAFYQPHVQLWRAQLCIVALTIMLMFVATTSHIGTLWILYLPASMMISRYGRRSRWFFVVAIEVSVALLCIGVMEIWARDTPTITRVGETGARITALFLAAFLLHYLAQVEVTTQRGAEVRHQVFARLLEHALLDTHGKTLWLAIEQACREAVNAQSSELYVCDRVANVLHHTKDDTFPTTIPISSTHIAARAVRLQSLERDTNTAGHLTLAAPLYGLPDNQGEPLGVIVLQLRTDTSDDQSTAQTFLIHVLNAIWSLCAHAALHDQRKPVDRSAHGHLHHLRLEEVLDAALDNICVTLGFAFATISIVNESQQEICTVRGRHVPVGWIADAHHSLSSHDIQADVLRTGRTVVIDAWDDRFDQQIWDKYQHANLVRVWVPLGQCGIIETGFSKQDYTAIPEPLIAILQRYAADLTVAIQNAQLFEREQRYAALLTHLHEVTHHLQTYADQQPESALLKNITEAVRTALEADVVLLYPYDRRAELLLPPTLSGTISGPQELSLPNNQQNIVQHIARCMEPYFQWDTSRDVLLTNKERQHVSHACRTFTERQGIESFAGVPLIARGMLFGVLCVNYRIRHHFSQHDRQAITLYAQMAATIIASGQLTREHERHRLEGDLHDAVKTSVRGMILLSHAVTDTLDHDLAQAKQHLHEVRRAGWGILADIELILNDLALTSNDHHSLSLTVHDNIRRLVGDDLHHIDIAVDSKLPALPTVTTRTLLFILREAIMNAVDHAHATHIQVRITCVDGAICLIVADDGCGFVVAQQHDESHRGLTNIRKRVTAAGGTLSLTSLPSPGTHLQINLPVKEKLHECNRDGITNADFGSSGRR